MINYRFLLIKQPKSNDGGTKERWAAPTESFNLNLIYWFWCHEIRNWQGKSADLVLNYILLSGHRTTQPQPPWPTNFQSWGNCWWFLRFDWEQPVTAKFSVSSTTVRWGEEWDLNKPECDIYNLSRSFVKGGTLWELLRRLWLEVSLISICRPCSPVILCLFNRFRPSQSSKYLKYKMLYCGLWQILYSAKSQAVLNSLGLNSRKWYIFHVRTGQGFNVIFMHQRVELHLGKLVGV